VAQMKYDAARASSARHVKPVILPLLGAAVFLSALLSLGTGPAPIPAAEILRAVAGQGSEVYSAILFEIRLPRLLLAVLVGGVLAMAGAVLQGYLRNPLAEASILGTSNAAALGAVIALYFGFAEGAALVLPLMAVGMAFASLACLFALLRVQASGTALILAGLAVGSLAGACISLALNLSGNPFAMAEIAFWLLGSLEDRSMVHVWLAGPMICVSILIFLHLSRPLDALSLGEEAAESMGVDLVATRLWLAAGVALGVGSAVAVSGAIGFIGLVVPHLLRPFLGHQPSRLLLPSFFAGAVLLTLADWLVRVLPTGAELRLGVVTAFLGIPFFIYLLARRRVF